MERHSKSLRLEPAISSENRFIYDDCMPQRVILLAIFYLAAASVAARADERVSENLAALLPPGANRTIDFVKDVQPILRKRCFECHAKGNEEGGLNLGVKSLRWREAIAAQCSPRGKAPAVASFNWWLAWRKITSCRRRAIHR